MVGSRLIGCEYTPDGLCHFASVHTPQQTQASALCHVSWHEAPSAWRAYTPLQGLNACPRRGHRRISPAATKPILRESGAVRWLFFDRQKCFPTYHASGVTSHAKARCSSRDCIARTTFGDFLRLFPHHGSKPECGQREEGDPASRPGLLHMRDTRNCRVSIRGNVISVTHRVLFGGRWQPQPG